MPETYTGTEGTDALAAGYDVMDGTEDRRDGWLAINKVRDYLANIQLTWDRITGKPATFPPSAHTHQANTIPTTGSNVQADIDYLASIKLDKAGGTVSGSLFLPNATAASSSYTVAYINGDGRVSKGASSERYKEGIIALDPADLGDLFPTLYSYRMIGSDTPRVGWIAERLNENTAQQPFVVYARDVDLDEDGNVTGSRLAHDEHGNPIPESIDFIALLIAQNAQLHQAVDLLAQRITQLEEPA